VKRHTFQPGDSVRYLGAVGTDGTLDGHGSPHANRAGMFGGRVYTVAQLTRDGYLVFAGVADSWHPSHFELVARRTAPAPEPEERSTLPTTPGSAVLVRSWSGEFAFGAYVLRHDGLWYGGKYGRRADDPGVGPEILRADYLCTVLHDEGAANG
jgi:hypothetical protein